MHCPLLGVQWDYHFVKQMRQEQGVPVAFPLSILGFGSGVIPASSPHPTSLCPFKECSLLLSFSPHTFLIGHVIYGL